MSSRQSTRRPCILEPEDCQRFRARHLSHITRSTWGHLNCAATSPGSSGSLPTPTSSSTLPGRRAARSSFSHCASSSIRSDHVHLPPHRRRLEVHVSVTFPRSIVFLITSVDAPTFGTFLVVFGLFTLRCWGSPYFIGFFKIAGTCTETHRERTHTSGKSAARNMQGVGSVIFCSTAQHSAPGREEDRVNARTV